MLLIGVFDIFLAFLDRATIRSSWCPSKDSLGGADHHFALKNGHISQFWVKYLDLDLSNIHYCSRLQS